MTATTRPTPVIVGAAQVIQRPAELADLTDARGPIELMIDAVLDAADDAGSRRLLDQVGFVGVAGGLWSFVNPGQLVAARIGAPGAATCLSAISGSAPQDLVGVAAERIAAGDIEVALVIGGEARASSVQLRKREQAPHWLTEPGDSPPEILAGITDDAVAETLYLGAAAPGYALIDESLRRHLGRSVEDHRDHIAALWEGFSRVAATNPYAWDQRVHSAAEIREPTAANRMISTPYPKAMVANNTVDMASAVLLCSTEVATTVGISADRFVYPYVSTRSYDTWLLAQRDVLHETPALAVAGRAALELAGLTPSDITNLDLYACFPSIVELSTAALGIDPKRQLTVTGGLGFAGSPIGNAAGQAIAAMVPLLRDGGYGFVHANGGIATKHAFGVYSNEPPSRPFRRVNCQDHIELRERAVAPPDWAGDGYVEAATVMYDREGPSHVVAAVRTDADARALIKTFDPDLVTQAEKDGLDGVRGPLAGAEPIG